MSSTSTSTNISSVIQFCSEFVYQQLGRGHTESTYRKALSAELQVHFDVEQEYHLPQYFETTEGRSIQVGDYRADIVIPSEKLVIELKTVTIKERHLDQVKIYSRLLHYDWCCVGFGEKLEYAGLQNLECENTKVDNKRGESSKSVRKKAKRKKKTDREDKRD